MIGYCRNCRNSCSVGVFTAIHGVGSLPLPSTSSGGLLFHRRTFDFLLFSCYKHVLSSSSAQLSAGFPSHFLLCVVWLENSRGDSSCFAAVWRN